MSTEAAEATQKTSSPADQEGASGSRRGKKSAGRGNGKSRRRRRGPPGVDRAPPRFDVTLLADLTPPPLWQAVHPAKVAEVTEAAVFVDVAPRDHEPLRALVDPREFGGTPPSSGDELAVRLLDPPKAPKDPAEGEAAEPPLPVASVRQALDLASLDRLLAAKEAEEEIPGVIVGEVKGGYSVALFAESADEAEAGHHMRAFLPKSHGEHPRLHEAKGPIGEADLFKITDLEPERANVVLSRKARLSKRYKEATERVWATVKEGEKVTGRVRALVPFGAFVDLGGVDALLHASDLSWDRQPRPASVLKVGQEVQAQVILVDKDNGKIKISLKHLQPNPWEDMKGVLKEGSDVEGDVVALTDYGAFVRIAEGVEGLIHLSEVTWDRIKHVSQRFHIGDRVTARVLDVDFDNRRVSLSTRALEPNPFEQVAEKFPAGTVLRVKVKSLTDFGAFVALDDNVDGMVHIGELSWTEHYTHPSQMLTIGDEIEVVVLNVDVDRQRVACSIKQLQENPWQKWEETYQRGARLTLKVSRVTDGGAQFEVEEGLSGFCATRDLSTEPGARAADLVRVGDELELEVKALDKRRRQVALSARAVIEGDTRAAYDEYKRREAESGAARTTLGDALKDRLGDALGEAEGAGSDGPDADASEDV